MDDEPALIIHWKYPSKAFEKFSLIRNFLNVSRRSTLVLSLENSLQNREHVFVDFHSYKALKLLNSDFV